jgi:hypothetical protein
MCGPDGRPTEAMDCMRVVCRMAGVSRVVGSVARSMAKPFGLVTLSPCAAVLNGAMVMEPSRSIPRGAWMMLPVTACASVLCVARWMRRG